MAVGHGTDGWCLLFADGPELARAARLEDATSCRSGRGIARLLRALQVGQQVEDGGLDRHVKRGDGFVAHNQLGLARERPGDGDALFEATR